MQNWRTGRSIGQEAERGSVGTRRPSEHGARELRSARVPLISENSRSFRRVASRRDAMAQLPGAGTVRVRSPKTTPRPGRAFAFRRPRPALASRTRPKPTIRPGRTRARSEDHAPPWPRGYVTAPLEPLADWRELGWT